MQADAVKPGQNVIIIDDLIATGVIFSYSVQLSLVELLSLRFRIGGSAKAAGELITKQGCKTIEYLFVIELTFLKGSQKLDGPVYSIVQSDD